MDLLDDDLIDLRRRRASAASSLDGLHRRAAELPATNADLAAWKADPQAAATAAASCYLCGRPPRATCRACGRVVCAAHHWVMLALCDGCAPAGDRTRAKRGPGRWP